MQSVEFYVLDSALGATSLLSTRYAGDNFEEQPREYVPPTGVYLRLYGRSREGSSVVVEIQREQGLSVQFLDVNEDPECSDEVFADNVKRAVLDQLDSELLKKLNPDPDALEDVDLLSATVEGKPCFYGFEPSPTDPLAPRERRVVSLFTDHLRLYRAIRKVAEIALHETPLDCGARPCELAGKPQAAVMHAMGLGHGQWLQARSDQTASAAADVVLICTSENLRTMPELATTIPPLVLASYDIECSSGPPAASGGYAFPDACKKGHKVRCIAVATTTLADPRETKRYFLHAGPAELTADCCAAVAEEEGAADAAVNLVVRHYRTETELLHGVAALMRDELRPDVLYSYNGNSFDAPFLAQRIEETMPPPSRSDEPQDRYLAQGRRSAAHAWGRTPMDSWAPRKLGVPKTEEQMEEIKRRRAQGKVVYEPTAFDSPGMAHHDVLDYGQSLSLETSKLADVAAEVLGTTKTDLAIQEVMDIMRTSDVERWARVAIYNVRDADLPMRIMLARDQVAFSLQIAAVSGCSLPQVCAGGQQKRLLSMVLTEVWQRGMVFNEPSKLDFEARPWLCGGGEKVKGATVLEIQPGYYRDPVVTCDFSSLYPSILISRNLCPSKLLLPLDAENPDLPASTPPDLKAATRAFKVEERDADIVHHHHVIQREAGGVGVIPAIAERILSERKDAKREMKQHAPNTAMHALLDAKQQALKVICNSLYGALNAVLKGPLFCRPLGGIVTAEGRNAIAVIQLEVARVEDAKVVAGDTDSVMFKLAGRTLEQAEEIGTEVAARVTTRLRADGAHAMELSYEKTMLPSVFVAKKAYAYIKHEPGKPPTHVSMGLMSKKRGTSALFKDAFIDCEHAYLLDPKACNLELVRQVHLLVLRNLVRLISTSPPEAFVKTTMLKPEDAYLPGYNAPHVNAARRLVKATECPWPGNTRFSYVQAQPEVAITKSNKKASDYSMELNHFIDTKSTIDTAYYLESVRNRFESLLKFTISDAPERFKELITTLERRSANTLSVASYFGRGPVAESEIAIAAAREYPDAVDARTAEVLFWKSTLESDAATPKSGPFSETWQAPRSIVVCNQKGFQPKRTITETALVAAVSTKEKVELALMLHPGPASDPEVSAALDGVRETEEYRSAVRAKESAAAAGRRADVESKKRTLAEAGAAIAAQPRLGATNSVPPKRRAKSGAMRQPSIASFCRGP